MTQDEYRSCLAAAGLDRTNCFCRISEDGQHVDKIVLRGRQTYIERRPRLGLWDVLVRDAKQMGYQLLPKLVWRGDCLDDAIDAALRADHTWREVVRDQGITQEVVRVISKAQRTSKESQ